MGQHGKISEDPVSELNVNDTAFDALVGVKQRGDQGVYPPDAPSRCAGVGQGLPPCWLSAGTTQRDAAARADGAAQPVARWGANPFKAAT